MISVVIPVYKKTELFLKNLKINLPFLKECEVIIVNDDPQTSIKNQLKNFSVALIENEKNLGFGGAVNVGVKKAKGEFVTLINSDVVLENNDFNHAIDHFKKNRNLFAVGFAQKEKNGSLVGKNRIFWKSGFFQHSASGNLNQGINAWAEGGACMIDRRKFNQLGGFDEIYSPFYWEDIDLSYRAWKNGYEIMFDPEVVVEHFHESTIGAYFTPKEIKTIAYRNQFIFVWKNITDRKLIWNHLLLLKINLLIHLLKDGVYLTKGYWLTLLKTSQILKKRRLQKKSYKYHDQDIISKFYE